MGRKKLVWCVYIESACKFTILLEPKEKRIIIVAKERFILTLIDFHSLAFWGTKDTTKIRLRFTCA